MTMMMSILILIIADARNGDFADEHFPPGIVLSQLNATGRQVSRFWTTFVIAYPPVRKSAKNAEYLNFWF